MSSYVIQNFFFSSKFLSITPRLRVLLLHDNVPISLFLIKTHNFFFLVNKSSPKWGLLFNLYKLFFNVSIYNFFLLSKFIIDADYIHNIDLSARYWIYKFFFLFLKSSSFLNSSLYVESVLAHPLYRYPIKLARPLIGFKIFKNFFFYKLLLNTRLWNVSQLEIYFHRRYLFSTLDLFCFFFYSGPFFKIYTF